MARGQAGQAEIGVGEEAEVDGVAIEADVLQRPADLAVVLAVAERVLMHGLDVVVLAREAKGKIRFEGMGRRRRRGGGGLCWSQVQTSLGLGSSHLEVQGAQALGQGCRDIIQLVIGQMEKLQLLQVLQEEGRDQRPCSQPTSALCTIPFTPWHGRFGLKPAWIHPPGQQPQHPPGKLRAGGQCWGSC